MKTALISCAFFAGVIHASDDDETKKPKKGKFVVFDDHKNATEDDALLSLIDLPKVDPVYVSELVGAFFAELVYINRLDSLQGCAVDSKQTIDATTAFI